jgi:LCP family protein required for cell wall assembly
MSVFSHSDEQLRAPRRRRMWWRMLLGCVLVVAAAAATVATGGLLEVKGFVDALKQSPQLKLGNELANADAGGPQTILLIGSDKRAKSARDANTPAHSDTMLLIRLDPSQPETTMLSIPRDLKITLRPDKGRPSTQKINASYTIGGAKLTVKTIKQVLGVQINHVVDINFLGFKEVVNYLGCVYAQVDRRYFNDNSPPAGGGTPYATINIQPGYQKLCGSDALDYVRFRHLDTDLVRSARQQDFLRQIKQQVGAAGLVAKRAGLEKIFGKYSSTDIRSTDDVLRLLELLVQSAGHPVHQVVFQSNLGPSYVTSTPAQLQQTVHQFLNGGIAEGHVHIATARKHRKTTLPPFPLSTATAEDIVQAKTVASSLPFKLYYPVRRVQGGFGSLDTLRPYLLDGHYAYVVVVAQGLIGQYYDLEGTTWSDPPILRNSNQTVKLGGRTLRLYFEGQKIRVIAWHDGLGTYWLTNTLQDILSNRQMLQIAQSAQVVH